MAKTIPDDALYDDGDIIIRANLNRHNNLDLFAISEGGADSCILGRGVYILSQTSQYARLQGYNSADGTSRRIKIASGAIKTVNTENNYVIYVIHEAPHLPESDTTPLSEYQMRDHGTVVDSCARTHILSHNPITFGTQQISCTLNNVTHCTPLVNYGGTMGLWMLPFEEGDMDRYPFIEITSSKLWIPSRHRQAYNVTTAVQDTVDSVPAETSSAAKMPTEPVDPITVDSPAAEMPIEPVDPITVDSPAAEMPTEPVDPIIVDSPTAELPTEPNDSVPVKPPPTVKPTKEPTDYLEKLKFPINPQNTIALTASAVDESLYLSKDSAGNNLIYPPAVNESLQPSSRPSNKTPPTVKPTQASADSVPVKSPPTVNPTTYDDNLEPTMEGDDNSVD